MAHRTLIGGTAYEISGGKTLVGGTAYKIDKGKTMIDGTVREIAFVLPKITVKIVNNNAAAASFCNVQINGTTYSYTTTLEIESGTSITAYVYAKTSNAMSITLNGSVVASGSGNKGVSYTFVPNCEVVTLTLRFFSPNSASTTIEITTS